MQNNANIDKTDIQSSNSPDDSPCFSVFTRTQKESAPDVCLKPSGAAGVIFDVILAPLDFEGGPTISLFKKVSWKNMISWLIYDAKIGGPEMQKKRFALFTMLFKRFRCFAKNIENWKGVSAIGKTMICWSVYLHHQSIIICPKSVQGPPSDPEVVAWVHTLGSRAPGRRPIIKEID